MSEHYLSDSLSCEIVFCKFKDIAHNAEIDKVILKKGDGNWFGHSEMLRSDLLCYVHSYQNNKFLLKLFVDTVYLEAFGLHKCKWNHSM